MNKAITLMILAMTLSACNAQRLSSVAPPAAVQAQSTRGVEKAVRASAQATFVYMDTNRDGVLNAVETRFSPADTAIVDRNHNGLITPKEFITWVLSKTGEVANIRQYAADMFTRADVNHDTFVDQAEFAPMTTSGMVHFTTFTLSDSNRDRRLSLSEFEDMVAWTKASMAEFQNVPTPPPVPFTPPVPAAPTGDPSGYGSDPVAPVPAQP